MLRGSVSLLSRLALRAPLARVALPLLAAYAPEALRPCGGGAAARSLHVFARRRDANHTKVAVGDGADASDLKDAVCAKLKLDAPPDCVRLLREVEGGGAPVPLDSLMALAEQGVREGTRVLIEVLPLPLPYVLVKLSGAHSHTKVVLAPGADAYDLAKAAIAELKLDAAPGSVRLLREVEGCGAPVPLKDCDVAAGSKVIIEVPLLAPLPPPLAFEEERLGGEVMMAADLRDSLGIDPPLPFYLTLQEHSDVMAFLSKRPSPAPQMLLLVGPIKCGKTSLLHTVIPRLLAARCAAAGLAQATTPRPVPFSYTFPHALPAEPAAEHFVWELLAFAGRIGIAMEAQPPRPGSFLDAMPRLAALAAERVHERGGELWLLLDELGAPIVASTLSGASRFTEQLKDLVGRCSPFARLVGTGSGMLALLTAINAASPNGWVLASAMPRVHLGREPAPPAALAMAQGILAAHARQWPTVVAPAMSPQAVLALLAHSAHGGHTSPRPALVAYLATIVVSTQLDSAEEVLEGAMEVLLAKLRSESARDTATALLRMPMSLRKALRALAVLGRPPDATLGAARFILQLCETGLPLRLLPPYNALLRSWIASDGSVSVSAEGNCLEESVRRNLLALSTFSTREKALGVEISEAVLHVLARNGVGAPLAGSKAGEVCAPTTVEEVAAVPAVQTILKLLDAEAIFDGRDSKSRSSLRLRKTLDAGLGSGEQVRFMETAGLTILMWVRNVEAHVFFEAEALPRSGLSSAVVKEAVSAALEVVLTRRGAEYELDATGVLWRRL